MLNGSRPLGPLSRRMGLDGRSLDRSKGPAPSEGAATRLGGPESSFLRLEARGAVQPAAGGAALGPDELLAALSRRVFAADKLDRAVRLPEAHRRAGPEAEIDIDAAHPLYGAYLTEWLERESTEPGRALVSLFRGLLGEMRAAVSRQGGKR